jgi:hypothetical protein
MRRIRRENVERKDMVTLFGLREQGTVNITNELEGIDPDSGSMCR